MNRSFYIAGVQFRPKDIISNAMKAMSKDDYLKLEPEPTNKFDPNAIKIVFEGDFIGYVPKKFSSEIVALLEAGIELDCVVMEVNPNAKDWEKCKVMVTDEGVEQSEDVEHDYIDEGGSVS